ncbi:MAG: hypothetical protein P4L51_23470 [Puia sp.]|nr:hypothetical protein [Puia sp.]
MYQIKKFADCWAVFNLESDLSRSLTEDEVLHVRVEFPTINSSEVVSIFVDEIRSLEDKP